MGGAHAPQGDTGVVSTRPGGEGEWKGMDDHPRRARPARMLSRRVAGRCEDHDSEITSGRSGRMAAGRHFRGNRKQVIDRPGGLDTDDREGPLESGSMFGGEKKAPGERPKLLGDRGPENESGIPNGNHRVSGGDEPTVNPRHRASRATSGSANSQGIHCCRAFTAHGCRTPGSTRHAEWRIGDLNP